MVSQTEQPFKPGDRVIARAHMTYRTKAGFDSSSPPDVLTVREAFFWSSGRAAISLEEEAAMGGSPMGMYGRNATNFKFAAIESAADMEKLYEFT